MFFRNFNQYRNSISLIQFPRKNIFSDTFQNKLFSFFWLRKIDKHISLWNFANKSGVKFSDRKIKCLISVKLIEVVPFKTRKKMGNFVFSTYLQTGKLKIKLSLEGRNKINASRLWYSRQWRTENRFKYFIQSWQSTPPTMSQNQEN